MNPTAGDVHVNTPLTNISIAYFQDQSRFIAAKVFPNIPVAKRSDRYWVYNSGDFNRDEMEVRAPGTESAGGGYNVDSTPTYYCPVYAFHKDIDDQTRSNEDSPLNSDRDATIYVTTKALIKREKIWASKYFVTGVWTRELTGVSATPTGTQRLHWSDQASNPIEDIRAEKTRMLELTGFEPNTLTLGRKVWDALIDHPDLVDRIKYSGGVGTANPAIINRAAMAALFEVDRILVSEAIENTAKEGQTAAHQFIAGKHALLSYSPPAPGLQTPTAGYTFSWTGHIGAGVEGNRIKQFRIEAIESDRIEIQIAFDMKLVGADLGTLFYGIVA